jgi:hypothetical protein
MAGINSSSNGNQLPNGWDADDVELAAALERVSVPAGAKQRTLARLQGELSAEQKLEAIPSVTIPSVTIPSVTIPSVTIPSVTIPSVTDESRWGGRAEPDGQPAFGFRMTRRRMFGIGGAAAVAAASLLVYVSLLPLSQSHLTSYCTRVLDELAAEESPRWQVVSRDRMAQRLAALSGQFSQPLSLVGAREIAAPGLAGSCTLYKFTARNGTLQVYVFDCAQPKQVAGLAGGLKMLTASSSGWSLAAMQLPDQLLVVATEGDVQQLLRSMQLA